MPQLLESGAADVTTGIEGRSAAMVRQLQVMELVEEERGVGWVLGGGNRGNNSLNIKHLSLSKSKTIKAAL